MKPIFYALQKSKYHLQHCCIFFSFASMKQFCTKQNIFLLLFFLLNIPSILAQDKICDCDLQGYILDEDGEPLPGAVLFIPKVNTKLVSNEKGFYQIKGLCKHNYLIEVHYTGYSKVEQNVSIKTKSQTQNFQLSDTQINLEEVTVTTEKEKEKGSISISQQTLGKDALSADLTQSLAAALSEVEGVTFTSVGNNVQLPIIHGLYGNRVLVLNNGFKHGFQNWGTDHAPEIDISTANSVTIVKGAAGVRYGPEALGGAIVVEADPLLLNKAWRAKIGTGYQTNGRGYFTNAEVAQGLKNWSYHIGANYTQIGDRQTPDYSLTNSGKIEKSINAGLRYETGDWSFKVYYSLVDQNLALLRASIEDSGNTLALAINSARVKDTFIKPFSYDITEPNQLVQHHLGKFEVSWWYTEDASLTFRYGKQLNQRQEFDARRNSDIPIIDL